MAGKMTIMTVSGTVDKLLPLAIMTTGAVATDMEVSIYLSFYAVLAFKKEMVKSNQKYSKDFEELVPLVKDRQKLTNGYATWYDMLKKAKAAGKVKIRGCSSACDLVGVTKDDFDPIVDEIVGIGNYIKEASESQITLFV
jgi:peroxiredoxin family protein